MWKKAREPVEWAAYVQLGREGSSLGCAVAARVLLCCVTLGKTLPCLGPYHPSPRATKLILACPLSTAQEKG